MLEFKGGETVALKRLHYYLWDSDLVADYFNTRNGMLGGDYSTKFSPWLAHGCLSPRQIFHEISKYESQREKNKSTYWVSFELLWRDYFRRDTSTCRRLLWRIAAALQNAWLTPPCRFFTQKHGSSIFFEGGIIGKKQQWNDDEELFLRWRDGKTGMPLIDANMRELKETGMTTSFSSSEKPRREHK